MMKRASALLILACASCTGENVDEAFVAQHGALLARVDCVCASPACGTTVNYWAIMFLDGSSLVQGNGATAFHERSDSAADKSVVSLNPEQDHCGPPGAEYFAIDDGTLTLYHCGSVHEVDETVSTSTGCSGFNKSLFD